MSNWFEIFTVFRGSELKRSRIADGLMMYETDDANKPVTFRFSDGETRGQYSLTRSEAKYLANLLTEHLEKDT